MIEMRKLMMKLAVGLCLAVSLSTQAAESFTLGDGKLPSLNWEKRSDWTDVKDLGAKGDGKADDTAAIQAALDTATDGTTIYLPPGNYRVTKTLNLNVDLNAKKRILGFSLIGHGKDSVLSWDGEAGGKMFQDDSVAQSRFVGFVLDGKDKAAIGYYHFSMKGFETEVDYRHCGFLNFTVAGVLAAPDDKYALAEVVFENCLFQNCGVGVSFMQFNDLDYTFDGCEFRFCGYGLKGHGANFYVRNCGFYGSKNVDISGNFEAGSSVRRSLSTRSPRFLETSSAPAPFTVEDCRVFGEKSNQSAIRHKGTSLIFDCVFDSRTSIELNRDTCLVANNRGGAMILGDSARLYQVASPGPRLADLMTPDTHFLRSKIRIPGKVFDAKRDFGAKGDGKADDSDSLQKAIDAARAHGKDSIVYLPAGRYNINDTLRVEGSDYFVGGSGFRSSLVWKGAKGGTMIEVAEPRNLVIESLSVGNHDAGKMDNGVDILQRGSGAASQVTYENVYVFGMYQKEAERKGLRFEGLGKDEVVILNHVQGNLRFADCGEATILAPVSYEGSITVEGKGRGGLLGFMTRLSTHTEYGMRVKDSQSLVASDYYYEQSSCGFKFEGKPGDAPGRVSTSSPKVHFQPDPKNKDKPKGGPMLAVDNYSGQIILGPDGLYHEQTMGIKLSGDNPCQVCLFGSVWYSSELAVEKSGTQRLSIIGNRLLNTSDRKNTVADNYDTAALAACASALDDYRRLGQADWRLLHGYQANQLQVPKLLDNAKTLLFYGDSLTDGSSYPDYVVNTLNATFPGRDFTLQNSAVCGNNANNLLQRFESDVLSKKPDVVFVCVGTNDCFQKRKPEDYRRDLEALVAALRGNGATVALIRPSHLGDPDKERSFQEFLQIIDTIGKEQKLLVIDAHGLFIKWEKEGKEMLGPDKVHHGADGFEGMARAVLDGLGLEKVTLVKEVKPWPNALTDWEVSAVVQSASPEDWKNFSLAKDWHPFDKAGLLASLPWGDKPFVERGGVMPLALGKSEKGSFAFVRTRYQSDTARKAVLEIGGAPPLCVWLNGKSVLELTKTRGYHPNATRIEVDLVKGANEFVVSNNYLVFLNLGLDKK